MSFELKYLKYKQKYQELKRIMNQSGGSVHQLTADNYSEDVDIVLTDTPVNGMNGGSIENTTENNFEGDFLLTDTPANNMEGGFFGFNILNNTRQESTPDTVPPPVPPTPTEPTPTAPAPTTPAPETLSPTVTENKHSVTNNTDYNNIEDIQNTEDIERLFSQLGGKHKRRKNKITSSTISSSSSSESSDSIFDSTTESSISLRNL